MGTGRTTRIAIAALAAALPVALLASAVLISETHQRIAEHRRR